MLGYDHASFWEQTPHTIEITFDAWAELQAKGHNERAWVAWHTAALPRQKHMPPLRKLMVNKSHFVGRPATYEEQIAGLVRWVQATGGTVKNG